MMFGNPSTCGNPVSVTLSPSGEFGIIATWDNSHHVTQDTVFAIYLNGRLAQITPGNITTATLAVTNTDTQELDVLAWPAAVPVPDTYYLGLGTRRAHLDWVAVADADLAGYNIYHGNAASPTDLYDTQRTVTVNGIAFDFNNGATAIVTGVPALSTYHNCTLTVTVTAADEITVSNDVDSIIDVAKFTIGQPVNVYEGVTITIMEQPDVSDTITLIVGIATYYDSRTLPAGTHYFRVAAVDRYGNESVPTNDVVITITPPPGAVDGFTLAYDADTDSITADVVQTPGATSVAVYGNYDASTNHLLPYINYGNPIATASITTTGTMTLLTGMASRPEGRYWFAIRAVTDGVESDDTTNASISMPYAEGEPTIVSASIRQLNSTDYTLVIYATGAPLTEWNISWTPDDDSDTLSGPGVTSESDMFIRYDYDGTVPGDGEYTFTIRAGTAGAVYTITHTFDTVAPDTPTGLVGVAY